MHSRRSFLYGSCAGAAVLAAKPGIANRLLLRDYAEGWTPFNITSATRIAWWRSSDTALMTFSGSGVTSWKDRIGGISVTPNSTAPTLGATSGNGFPGVTFDGVANCLQTTSLGSLPIGSTPGEIWAVFGPMQSIAATAHVFNYGGTSGATIRDIRKISSDRGGVSDGGTTNTFVGTGIPLFTAGYNIVSGQWSGTTLNGTFNGSDSLSNPTTIAALNTSSTRLRFGANLGTSPAQFGGFVLMEVLVLSGQLNLLERYKTQGYFAWKYNLAGLLP